MEEGEHAVEIAAWPACIEQPCEEEEEERMNGLQRLVGIGLKRRKGRWSGGSVAWRGVAWRGVGHVGVGEEGKAGPQQLQLQL